MKLRPVPKEQVYLENCEPAQFFCMVCGRKLKNPKSAAKRIGPVCEKKFNKAKGKDDDGNTNTMANGIENNGPIDVSSGRRGDNQQRSKKETDRDGQESGDSLPWPYGWRTVELL